MIGIYCITNLVNGKRYVGQSVDVELRITKHKDKLKHNKHINEHLQSAYNKYGKDAFVFEVLEECLRERLDELECQYIERFKATDKQYGYNRKDGGHYPRYITDSLREKLSQAHKGIPLSPEHRKALSRARLGKKRGPEARRRMSESRKGIVFSEAHRENLAKARIGVVRSPHREETKRKISASLMGHPPTQKTGWKHTPEAKQKMRESRLAYLKSKLEQKGKSNEG